MNSLPDTQSSRDRITWICDTMLNPCMSVLTEMAWFINSRWLDSMYNTCASLSQTIFLHKRMLVWSPTLITATDSGCFWERRSLFHLRNPYEDWTYSSRRPHIQQYMYSTSWIPGYFFLKEVTKLVGKGWIWEEFGKRLKIIKIT